MSKKSCPVHMNRFMTMDKTSFYLILSHTYFFRPLGDPLKTTKRVNHWGVFINGFDIKLGVKGCKELNIENFVDFGFPMVLS